MTTTNSNNNNTRKIFDIEIDLNESIATFTRNNMDRLYMFDIIDITRIPTLYFRPFLAEFAKSETADEFCSWIANIDNPNPNIEAINVYRSGLCVQFIVSEGDSQSVLCKLKKRFGLQEE